MGECCFDLGVLLSTASLTCPANPAGGAARVATSSQAEVCSRAVPLKQQQVCRKQHPDHIVTSPVDKPPSIVL